MIDLLHIRGTVDTTCVMGAVRLESLLSESSVVGGTVGWRCKVMGRVRKTN